MAKVKITYNAQLFLFKDGVVPGGTESVIQVRLCYSFFLHGICSDFDNEIDFCILFYLKFCIFFIYMHLETFDGLIYK